ncbi:beta-glucosidase [Kineococcus sp. SYSU DK001]|uniref:beta-glucosidase n=1 Tax=Kineococcus sp. SYSU DK001 TaxID=3383122 RepID=UPI003D7C7437
MPRPTAHRPRSRSRRITTTAATTLALLAPLVTSAPATAAPTAADAPTSAACRDVPWMDRTRTPEQRAAALLAASSQHQKYRWLVEQPANSPQQTDFQGVRYPAQLPCTPTVVYTDGPEGVRNVTGVTAFPAAIAAASTWDEQLVYDKHVAQADEAFGKGKNVILAPGLSGGRTPLAGRTPEYLGEDPVLSGVLGAAGVRGIEAEGRVLADLKHYVANEQELDREESSSNVDERTLRQVYDLPFEIAVRRGDPESVMCSFNQVNGVYACEDERLNTVLKDEFGMRGYVVSDFGSVHSTAASLMNGLDQELNRPVWFTPYLLDEALTRGQITQARIDEAATRVVTAYIRGGLFDNPLPARPRADVSPRAHTEIARRTAEQGSVLLANDGILPLRPERGQKIAVVGATASTRDTDGLSAADACGMPLPERFGGNSTMACENLVAADTALRDRARQEGASVTFTDGTDLEAAAAAAADADVTVVFGYQRAGEFADVPDLRLNGNGDALIDAVAGANPNTVVVLQTGTAVEMPWLPDVRAVLETWYAGEQQGPAIASLLFGDVNPSGKLPMTFPKSLADTPTNTPEQYPGVFADGSTERPEGSTEIRQVDYSEGLQVGHRWYEAQGIEPLFPFGHGLSYTSFAYGPLEVVPAPTGAQDGVTLRFSLRNTGEVDGTEVAQAYLSLPDAAGEPFRRLVGWQRVALDAGEERTVEIALSAADVADLHLLEHFDVRTGTWVTTPGTHRVDVGGSLRTSTSAEFELR